jgi:AraC-like DNA-binding protein
MGALDSLLSGPRAQGAFLLRLAMEPPWSLSVEDEAPLTVMAQLEGHAWVLAGDEQVRLEPGDVSIVKGPDHYIVTDDPTSPVSIIVNPDQQCVAFDGRSLVDEMLLGLRTWGNDLDGSAQMLVGTYNLDSEVSKRLLRALPRQIQLRADEWQSPVVELLVTEVSREQPGQEVILDRLLDLLLMTAVRAWFDQPGHDAPGWYLAESDQAIGATVRLIHEQPAHDWTVAELAAEAGMSRAAYARRFSDVVGEPPMTYLTNWRLTLAADLLRSPGTTVGDVAEQVGYATPFGLSAAFKRVRGLSPTEHRQALMAGS